MRNQSPQSDTGTCQYCGKGIRRNAAGIWGARKRDDPHPWWCGESPADDKNHAPEEGSPMTTQTSAPKVRRVTIPPAMDAALVNRALTNGVSVADYIIGAIHEAMDRDMFAEMDAETEADR